MVFPLDGAAPSSVALEGRGLLAVDGMERNADARAEPDILVLQDERHPQRLDDASLESEVEQAQARLVREVDRCFLPARPGVRHAA